MPYLGPSEARTFPVMIPQRAEACRVLMFYEHGPFWSKADQFFKDHGIYVPDKFFIPGMQLNKKLPGHFRCLDIEVMIPATSRKLDETEVPHNESRQPTPGARFAACWTSLARRGCASRSAE